jgi:hypothetical protein
MHALVLPEPMQAALATLLQCMAGAAGLAPTGPNPPNPAPAAEAQDEAAQAAAAAAAAAAAVAQAAQQDAAQQDADMLGVEDDPPPNPPAIPAAQLGGAGQNGAGAQVARVLLPKWRAVAPCSLSWLWRSMLPPRWASAFR